jgi:PKD repeat protein
MSYPWPPGQELPTVAYADQATVYEDLAAVKQPGGEQSRHWPDGPPGLAGQEPPPVASFTCTPPAPGKNMNVTLDGTGSAPGSPDFPVVSYDWAFSDGTAPKSGAVVTWRTPNKSGSYTITLTVTDSGGAAGSSSLVITF